MVDKRLVSRLLWLWSVVVYASTTRQQQKGIFCEMEQEQRHHRFDDVISVCPTDGDTNIRLG